MIQLILKTQVTQMLLTREHITNFVFLTKAPFQKLLQKHSENLFCGK
jgi:hypothetical protein